MANYKDMYHALLSAVFDTLDSMDKLKKAVLSAEDIYISAEETILALYKDESEKDDENPK